MDSVSWADAEPRVLEEVDGESRFIIPRINLIDL